VVVIGQDPATQETIARRILVGAAGHRVQGFLYKLGIDRSYAMVNTFLYSVYGSGGEAHKNDAALVAYRNRWLDALLVGTHVEAVIALGMLADGAWQAWKATPSGSASALAYAHITHPTAPQSAGGSDSQIAAATRALLVNWNQALQSLKSAIKHPDTQRALVAYGTTFKATELVDIPEEDLPPGLPDWMRTSDGWAPRTGTTPAKKRRTITVTVPATVKL